MWENSAESTSTWRDEPHERQTGGKKPHRRQSEGKRATRTKIRRNGSTVTHISRNKNSLRITGLLRQEAKLIATQSSTGFLPAPITTARGPTPPFDYSPQCALHEYGATRRQRANRISNLTHSAKWGHSSSMASIPTSSATDKPSVTFLYVGKNPLNEGFFGLAFTIYVYPLARHDGRPPIRFIFHSSPRE